MFINPETGNKVNLQSKEGKEIINSYIFQLGGSGTRHITDDLVQDWIKKEKKENDKKNKKDTDN